VLLGPEFIDKFAGIFAMGMQNMRNLRDLSLTLHNNGSQPKKFYLERSFIDLMQVLAAKESLESFEFNTEIEVLFNFLDDFFLTLTKF